MNRVFAVICRSDRDITLKEVSDKINVVFNQIKLGNPNGFMDEFEARFELICSDVAQDFDGTVEFKDDAETREGEPALGVYFNFADMTRESFLDAIEKNYA